MSLNYEPSSEPDEGDGGGRDDRVHERHNHDPREEGPALWFMVYGLWFRVQGSGFRVEGLGFRVQGLGFRLGGVTAGGRRWCARGWQR